MATDDYQRKLEQRLDDGDRADLQLWAAIDLVLDLLEHRGLVNQGHRRLLAKMKRHTPAGRPRVRLKVFEDKYAIAGPDIDCASRLHLCHARCCSFAVELSRQDLEEGELRWDLDEPYVLERGADGYCRYLDHNAGGCSTYHNRPATCRQFDCRHDARVWKDFDARIPAEMPSWLLPFQDLHRETGDGE